jgi:hypothetical protein
MGFKFLTTVDLDDILPVSISDLDSFTRHDSVTTLATPIARKSVDEAKYSYVMHLPESTILNFIKSLKTSGRRTILF